jgi:hypothetical protein
MKTIFRLSMVMAVAALFFWGGVAQPAEEALEPTSHEYLIAMDAGTLPSKPLVPIAVVKAFPEPGTWEYSQAMETGELPSMCGDVPCAAEEFTIIEVGTLRYRQGIDDGGGGE